MRSFDPQEPLLRVSAMPQEDGSHIVVIAVAHSISDGTSTLSLHSSL